MFDLPKILGVKSKLENCNTIGEVLAVLESNRSFIAKSFGLQDSVLDESVAKLKALETA